MHMLVRIGMENGIEGRSLAWALDFPGCFASGADETTALLRMPQALIAYAARIQARAASPWLELGNFDLRLLEVWDVYAVDEHYDLAEAGYEVNAWFKHDWKPLDRAEVLHGLELLAWNRQDLLELAAGLTAGQLDRERLGERWSIRGILSHVGGAEWWYLDRLGLAGMTRAALPKDPFERLAAARARLVEVLPDLAGRELVTGKQGELWSPRKLLRRILWHEQDHIGHISRLILEG